ncbi:MAG: helix-turn-helix domain-containing protein [Treponema sp.]|nr:helix-turn-helix domain-containing protein [Treponema sp.]
MLKAYKFRIYPVKEQKILISKTFGCARWYYNSAFVGCRRVL